MIPSFVGSGSKHCAPSTHPFSCSIVTVCRHAEPGFVIDAFSSLARQEVSYVDSPPLAYQKLDGLVCRPPSTTKSLLLLHRFDVIVQRNNPPLHVNGGIGPQRAEHRSPHGHVVGTVSRVVCITFDHMGNVQARILSVIPLRQRSEIRGSAFKGG